MYPESNNIESTFYEIAFFDDLALIIDIIIELTKIYKIFYFFLYK